MTPADVLMNEHRLIERMIAAIEKRMGEPGTAAPALRETVVDFFKGFSDRVHHGKEEDILFRALAQKNLSPEHRQAMNTLVQEHVSAREAVGAMLLSQEHDDAATARRAASALRELLKLYPAHIDLEDNRFFLPAMDYLSVHEQADILLQFAEFDRKLLHEQYRTMVLNLEHGARH